MQWFLGLATRYNSSRGVMAGLQKSLKQGALKDEDGGGCGGDSSLV